MNNFKAIVLAAIVFANQTVPVHVSVAQAAAPAQNTTVSATIATDFTTLMPTDVQTVTLHPIIVSKIVPATVEDVRPLREQVADLVTAKFGANSVQYVDYIITHESTWNVTAVNRGSGAYGLGQALPASKMAPFGADYRTNGITQAKWMLSYISERYSTPSNAVKFWKNHNWY